MPFLTFADRRRRFALALATTTLSGMLASASALAQTAAPAPDAAPQPATTAVGEIVVTATHRSESLQKVPISLQAFDTAKLEQNHVSSFADYANLLPSVSFETLGPGRSEPFFRGISVSGGQASTVGMYLNDVPLNSTGSAGSTASNPEVHIYDVERVEALSGPQGTLFGASSLAGTIRVLTNKPKFGKFDAGIDTEINKWGKGNAGGSIEGFVNLPIGQHAAVRLMGYYEKTGGYINNTHGTVALQSVPITLDNAAIAKNNYNPDEEYGGRAALAVEVAPDWTITPQVTYQYLNSKGAYNFDPRVGDLAVHDYGPTWMHDSWYQAELSIHGKIADFDLVSATGLFSRTINNANDYTYYTVTYDRLVAAGAVGTYYTNFTDKSGNLISPQQTYQGHDHERKFTQEVRVNTPASWPFQLTVGGFYQFQKVNYNENYYVVGLSQAINTLGFSPAVGGEVTPDPYYLTELDRHFKDGAAFAEGSVNVTHSLKLTGGIRHFVSDNGTYGFAGTWSSADNPAKAHQANGTAGCWNEDPAVLYGKFIHPYRLSCINEDEKYHEVGNTWKASVAWQFQPSKMLYATYSTGFRPGGGNRLANAGPYKADTLRNLEAGWKLTFGRNFRWNGAVYYEKWKGVQYVVIPPFYQGAGITVNAGDARVYGIESDVEWNPLDGLTLSSSAAYNDAKLATNFCNLVSNTDLVVRPSCSDATGDVAADKGTRLPRQPKFKGSVSARYSFAVDKHDSFVMFQEFYQSGSTSDLDVGNDALLGDTAGFATINLSAGTTFGKFSAEAYIQNLFDERGILSKNTFCSIQYCSGSSRSYPTKPRFFGLKIGYKY